MLYIHHSENQDAHIVFLIYFGIHLNIPWKFQISTLSGSSDIPYTSFS